MFERIVFMGTPEYALPTLIYLHEHFKDKIIGVFSQADKPRGRGKVYSPTPVKQWGLDHNMPVFTPHTKDDLVEELALLNPDLVVVIAYGMILPKTVTDTYFCVNLHGSILPKYRGASPMQASLLNGDQTTGVTLIHMDEGMDTGDILLKSEITLKGDETLGVLHDELSKLSAATLEQYLSRYSQGKAPSPTPQDHTYASYSKKISKDDLLLDLSLEPLDIFRKIKAYSPFPGAYAVSKSGLDKGKRVKILDAEIKKGQLHPLIVTPEGKGQMSYEEYVRGYGPITEDMN